MQNVLPFESLHELLSFHQTKLRGQPQHDFRLNSSVIQLRSSSSSKGTKNSERIELVLMRRRYEEKGLFVAIVDDSWEKLTATAVQLLHLPDEYYEKLVFLNSIPFPMLQQLLPLHPSRRQCVCWDASYADLEISLLASLNSPIHLILHPWIFNNKKKNRNDNTTSNDAGQQFVKCLAQRTRPFGSLTVYENALSDAAWTQLLQLLQTAPLLETLELMELDIQDAALLSNARVETLSLSHCSLADDGESLQEALSHQSGPTRLVLDQLVGWEGRLHHSRKTVPLAAWHHLMLTFATPTCRLQHLELGSSPHYDIGGFFLAFLEGLALNHSLVSLVIRKYDGILSFWDDLADIVLRHTTLRNIALVYESTVCHDAARMFRPLSRMLETRRDVIISYKGDYHNRTFERMIAPKLRLNRFHSGTQTLGQVHQDSMRAFLFAQALMNGCCGDSSNLVSREECVLRTWWLLSRNTDTLVTLLQH